MAQRRSVLNASGLFFLHRRLEISRVPLNMAGFKGSAAENRNGWVCGFHVACVGEDLGDRATWMDSTPGGQCGRTWSMGVAIKMKRSGQTAGAGTHASTYRNPFWNSCFFEPQPYSCWLYDNPPG